MDIVLNSQNSVAEIFEALPIEETQHMQRVGALVALFVRRLLKYEFFRKYAQESGVWGQAAIYHDIGKAWVSAEILTKPGHLTEGERMILCRHPEYAQLFFERAQTGGICEFPQHLLQPARESALYHHEWWNGKGYPHRLLGPQIPFLSRITAVCDAYDAMTSDRVYRRAHSHGCACRELALHAGEQFDPWLVRAFLHHDADFAAAAGEMLSLTFE
ncbi:HD-GYP domain-containing protein [Faecalispora anaeroviscerum]|uniref:HD-GYP domain-containing protein n=1 Tax=Faecalispora anaeroviscerum TaxID=2991836 RepID=UPI0024B883A6|nr:HD domain-containing phosphohydrolase [Faecalispora anaeroviscerum]